MMAGRSHRLLEWSVRGCSVDRSNRTPRFIWVEAIQVMASSHTSFAARTLIEIHFKGVLLARFGFGEGDEVTIVAILDGNRRPPHPNPLPQWGRGSQRFMRSGKSDNRGQGLLLGQQLVDQRARFLLAYT